MGWGEGVLYIKKAVQVAGSSSSCSYERRYSRKLHCWFKVFQEFQLVNPIWVGIPGWGYNNLPYETGYNVFLHVFANIQDPSFKNVAMVDVQNWSPNFESLSPNLFKKADISFNFSKCCQKLPWKAKTLIIFLNSHRWIPSSK